MQEIKIGQVLKRLLREKRKTLKEVSRETDIPYSTLHTWHENRQPKDILKAQRLARYFEVSLHELLFGEADAREEKPKEQISFHAIGAEIFKGKFEITVRRIE